MRAPVDHTCVTTVITQVACTLYYLNDEDRLHKAANAFGLLRQDVLQIIRKVCKAVTEHLGPEYIKVPYARSKRWAFALSNSKFSTLG